MLEFNDVSDIVLSLDQDFQELRDDAERRYDLYRFRKEPYVPDEIAREGKVRMVTAYVNHAATSIRSEKRHS